MAFLSGTRPPAPGRGEGDNGRGSRARSAPVRDDAVVALTKAFNLASVTDLARSIRDEVGFFQTIRAALAKSAPASGGMPSADRDLAVQQIVNRSVISTEIVDILQAA